MIPAASSDPGGSLLVRCGLVRTMDPHRPMGRSVRFIRGLVDAIDGAGGHDSDSTVLDLPGATMVPGLIDAHLHLVDGGLALGRLDLSEVGGRADFEDAIAERHRCLPGGEWLVGHGWSEQRWPGRDLPTKDWLRAAGDRPAVCRRMDIHAAVVNQAVLDRLPSLEDPAGGRVVRDASTGEPTGLLLEEAAWSLLGEVLPAPTLEDRRAAVRRAAAHAHRHGLVAVGTMERLADAREVLWPLRSELSLRCRITLLDVDPLAGTVDPASWPPGDARAAIIGIKSFADGTIGSRTAALLEPYGDRPDESGMLLGHARDDRIGDWAAAVADLGLSPSIHAIGDRAVRLALNAVEPIRGGASPRPIRLEHVQQTDPADWPRFRGLHASMQPLHKFDDGPMLGDRLGADRLSGSFAFRSLAAAGAQLAFGSDWPVVALDPIAGIEAAVTGRVADGSVMGVGQCLTSEEALLAYTRSAARCLGMERSGMLRVGWLGDATILDRDPLAVDWASGDPRDRPRPIATIVGGRVVWRADDPAPS